MTSPEAVQHLKNVIREYFRFGDMTANRAELVEAVFGAYPVAGREREFLHQLGHHGHCEHEEGFVE